MPVHALSKRSDSTRYLSQIFTMRSINNSRLFLLLGALLALSAMLLCYRENLGLPAAYATTSYNINVFHTNGAYRFRHSVKRLYTAISTKPQKLYNRVDSLAKYLPVMIGEIIKNTKTSIIDNRWTEPRFPKASSTPEDPVCTWVLTGFTSDGGEISYRECYRYVKVDGRYTRQDLSYVGVIMLEIVQLLKTYAPIALDHLYSILGGSYLIIESILYWILYATIDTMQRGPNATNYVLKLVLKWWANDFSATFLIETAVADVPYAYQKSFEEILHIGSILYPKWSHRVYIGYHYASPFTMLAISTAYAYAQHLTRCLSNIEWTRRQDFFAWTEDDDWIVLLVGVLSFKIVSSVILISVPG
jgi:hypothetical protein